MKSLLNIYRIGCWSFILVGLGHIVTSMLIPDTPERNQIIQEMKHFSISMGGTESNLYLFHEGFSLMMGLLLIAYGVLNLSLTKATIFPNNFTIIINIFTSFFAFIVSINYFFIVPVLFLSFAFLCFLITLIFSFKLRKN
ncbi:hypothetical protein MNBD_GAMMA04-2024 [hydrothermal vent metagenome]|uniref:Uncharacterized protein n=1 Tax=hydrothermal vent metagenome TaxID=652676 RepID=A0A3B0W7U6_9ZZZZ